jgi:Asp/Glu/hydantoin racemase
MLYGCTLGQHSGIVTINRRYIPWFGHQIRKYGLEQRVSGVHAMTFEPGQILRAYERDDLAAEVVALFEAQARPLVEQGVDVILPGGGIPMLLFSRLQGHNVDGAPVVNGIPIVIKLAETAVKLRRLNGLGVSRTSDYVKPPAEIIEEYRTNPRGL